MKGKDNENGLNRFEGEKNRMAKTITDHPSHRPQPTHTKIAQNHVYLISHGTPCTR